MREYTEVHLKAIERVKARAYSQKRSLDRGEIITLKRFDLNYIPFVNWYKSEGKI